MSQVERKQSRKQLRPWLEQHLNAMTYKGLRWLDKEKRIFLIAWKRQSNPSWDAASDSELFKAWSVHKGKYKEGDPEDRSQWKTRLRTALTKMKEDFEEMEELHNLRDPDNPYKVYRFLEEGSVCISKSNSQSSPSSEAGYSDSSRGSFQASPTSQIDFLEMSDTEMESARNMDQYGGMNDMNNVPTVVYDKMTCKTEGCMNISEERPSNLQAPVNLESDTPNFLFKESNNDCYSGTAQQQQPLPQDLQGIDGLVPFNSEIIANNVSIDQSLPSYESFSSKNSSNTNHVLTMQVYILGKCVYEEFIDGEARLFCGDLSQQCLAMGHLDLQNLFGPGNVQQIPIPEIDQIKILPVMNDKQKKLVRDIQSNMDRGLLIGGNHTNIYTQRLCKAHVSMWTQRKTVEKLNRDNTVIGVFDMELFKQQLDEYCPKSLNRPSTSVTFIFGQRYKTDNAVLDMSAVLFCVKVTHIRAKEMLKEAVDHASSITEDLSSNSIPEDALVDHLKQIQIFSDLRMTNHAKDVI